MECVAYQKPVSEDVGKRIILTAPNYETHRRPQVCQYTSYIGERHTTIEKTGDLRYLWRPSSDNSLPAKYKHEYVGGIGWGIPMYEFINRSRLQTGFHVKYKEPSHGVIEKLGHRYQNPWQPKPAIMDKYGKFSRGFLAWHMGEFENNNERDSKYAMLIKKDNETLPRLSRPPKLLKRAKRGRGGGGRGRGGGIGGLPTLDLDRSQKCPM